MGTGAIGLKVAEIGRAFGCRLLAYSRTHKDEAEKLGVKYVSLDELLTESDIVSLHVPLNEHTRGLSAVKNCFDETRQYFNQHCQRSYY